MKVLGVIPARFSSTRFPGKPLTLIHGKSMISRVYKQVSQAKAITELVVATDDPRIERHVKEFGGNVIMTDPEHPSGTDRCAEALERIGNGYSVVINIQGDEPYIDPEQIDLVADMFNDSDTAIATLVKQIKTRDELENRNIPKVVFSKSMRALYFSRYPVPHCAPDRIDEQLTAGTFYKHIGIYGYRASILPELTRLSKSRLEISESLEQLRWLENGYQIHVSVTSHESHAVDTPEDVIKIEKAFPD